MKHKTLSVGNISVISLILVYILTVSLFLLFFNELMINISTSRTFNSKILLPIALLLIVLFLVFILINIFRFIRNRHAGRAGSRYRIRLIFYFVLLSMLSSVPQGLLSVNFLNSALKTWFNDEVYNALNGGLNIALEYYHKQIKDLRALSHSDISERIVDEILSGRLIVPDIYPSLDSVVIYDDDGSVRGRFGDNLGDISFERLKGFESGALPKRSIEGISILSEYSIHEREGDTYHVLFSTFMSKQFDADTRLLADGRESFRQLSEFRTFFQMGIILVFLFFSLPLLLLAILVSFFLSSEISRPISNLEVAIRKVADGDFSYRLLNKEDDDLFSLSESFNQMIRELENTRESTRQTQKISAWQEIAQRLAHELRNPLTPIQLSAQRVLRNELKPGAEKNLKTISSMETIIHEVSRLDVLLKEFRDFARMPTVNPQYLPLLKTMKDCSDSYSTSFPDIVFDFSSVGETLIFHVDPIQIVQVFSNLFKNAVEAMIGSGIITVNAVIIKKGYLEFCRISIQDEGFGIKEEDKEKVFHPYFTTKKLGTGLGLPIIERIIFDHKGRIWLESELGKGTTFFIDLPMEEKHE